MTEKINKEELTLLKHTESLLKGIKVCLELSLLQSVAMPSASSFVILPIKTAMPK